MEQQHDRSDKKCNIYSAAANVLQKLKAKKATLRSLVFTSPFRNVKQLTALVDHVVSCRGILEEILSDCSGNGFMKEEIVDGSHEMALVLLYEYLLGKNFGRNVHFRKVLLQYKTDFKNAAAKIIAKHTAKDLKSVVKLLTKDKSIKIPRYMRVNLIKSTVEDVVGELQSEGWEYIGKIESASFKDTVLSMSSSQFGLDPHLPDVLVFPVGTDFHAHYLTTDGKLIQQDKASCMPGHILNPPPGSTVMDCCAAPGNKTSHIASLMKDNGKVIAMDVNFKRLNIMSDLLKRSGASCIELVHQDFLTVEASSSDASNIDYILMDPTCSGSGMIGQLQGKDVNDHDEHRIEGLKRLQISLLKHALRFPSVKRVVYSTCSIHKEENEEVVEEVMGQVSNHYRFVKVLPHWEGGRGLKEFPHAEYFLRTTPEQNLTQGFFVACFERVKGPREDGLNESIEDQKHSRKDLKKKRRHSESDAQEIEADAEENQKKKKVKKHSESEVQEVEPCSEKGTHKKKKSKKNKSNRSSQESMDGNDGSAVDSDKQTKPSEIQSGNEESSVKNKKHKKNKKSLETNCSEDFQSNQSSSGKKKKKKSEKDSKIDDITETLTPKISKKHKHNKSLTEEDTPVGDSTKKKKNKIKDN
ncbi:28S rRNA (cytosine-C(5))-methyltransferase-like [Physella acuta]|uniref:28S rRNA (cytosine-C(5))-methyltransferase-like n=1 Tax=Physella acuta TaxID=109671 RepID=UPI0027DE80FF|nr:28S rRNA (cytosine-C(5))-methyltransferase-like [Physella acuta]